MLLAQSSLVGLSTGTPNRLTRRLWQIAGLAALFPLLSFLNPFVVAAVNRALGQPVASDTGWALYTAVRLGLSALLVWRVLGLRRGQARQWSRGGGSSLRQFDPLMGLRAMASGMVLLGHYFGQVYLSGDAAWLPWATPLFRSNPYAGVWIFFTLSGFLMGKGFSFRYALTEQGIFAFYRNRLLRILPLYLAALGLVSALTTPALLLPRNWWQWMEVSLFDYRGDLPLPPIGALWSVSTEVQFYLLAPFLFAALLWCRARLGRNVVLLPFAVLSGGVVVRKLLFFWFARHALPLPGTALDMFVYKPLLPQLDLFVAGMSLNLLPAPRPLLERLRWIAPKALLTVAAVAMYVATAGIQHAQLVSGRVAVRYFIVVPCLVSLMASGWIRLAAAAGPQPIAAGWRGAWLRTLDWGGILTYCVYVFHIPLLVSFRRLLPAGELPFGIALRFFPVVAVTLLLFAYFFYRFVEEPFERLKSLSGTELVDAP